MFGFSVVNDNLCASLSMLCHFWYRSSLNDGVGGVVLDTRENPPLYEKRFASCNGEMAGILYLCRISMALRCSSSYTCSIGGPTGEDGETVSDGNDVVDDCFRRNRFESVCLYGGGGTKLIAYSS